MILTYHHETKDKDGIVTRLSVIVDYDFKTRSIIVKGVFVSKSGAVLEFSDCLDTIKGSPLDYMIDAIDWHQLYLDEKENLDSLWDKVKNNFRSIQTI